MRLFAAARLIIATLATAWLAPAGLITLAAPRLAAQGTAVGSAVAPDTGASAADTTGASLRPGDVVRITVWRSPELSGEFPVGADGSIQQPLYQQVQVTGVPLDTVRARIGRFLSQYQQNPQFVLEPLFRVAVGGEVRKPDLYPLSRETTISQAIAIAGGPTERGRLDRVRLLREGREVTADLTSANAEWAQEPVRSGDRIVVTRRRDFLREYLAPVATLVAAAAALANVLRR